MLLSENNIKSELSYAYLHAVASRAGCSVNIATRHQDNDGVDATIVAKEKFAADSRYIKFAVDVQLKATSDEPSVDEFGRFPFLLKIAHYNNLRDTDRDLALILVVLYMPPDPTRWLDHSDDGLISRRCAFWTSLRGAPESTNSTSQTVYLPTANRLSVEGLRSLLTRVSRADLLEFEPTGA